MSEGTVTIERSQTTNVAPLPAKDVLLSLRTGKVRPLGGVNIRTAINKTDREGKWEVTRLGLVGDEQHYEHHGGFDKALHQYCASHYRAWNEQLPGRDHLFKIGGFGENLSAANMSEDNVCIGDTFQLGPEVIVQVTQPRQPCYKLNHRFQHKKASSLTQSSGRTGWYLRVLKPGLVQQGDEFELVERIHPTWSISRVQRYLYHDKDDHQAIAELAKLPALGDEMLGIFQKRLASGTEDMSGRLEGDRLPVQWRPYTLVEKNTMTARAASFVFELAEGSIEPGDEQFGRFSHVRMQFGPDLGFSRAYSVVSGDMRRFELGIARDDNSRGGSIYLHDNLAVGDVVKIAKGHSALGTTPELGIAGGCTAKNIFVIGGIGVTAYLPEINRLSRQDTEFEIHYAVRSRKDAAYLDHLPTAKTTIYAKDEGQRLDLLRVIPSITDHDSALTYIYCCGPSSLLDACRDLATKLAYPRDRTHFEEFGGATTGTGDPFEAEVKTTGQVLKVPGDRSLLKVLEDAGFDIESSCEVGNCGTCMVDYCKGEVVHKGTALDEEQKGEMMLSCVSRGRGRIVIDC